MTDDAQSWRAAGFDDAARDVFRSWRINLTEALDWRSVGVFDGLTAARWTLAGTSPAQSARWRREGFDSVAALQWGQTGHDLDAALRARAAGLSPATSMEPRSRNRPHGRTWRQQLGELAGHEPGEEFMRWAGTIEGTGPTPVSWLAAHRYAMRGWVSDDAVPWGASGIDPEDAVLWVLLGLGVDDALAHADAGRSPRVVIHDWWSAGVPLREVAGWLTAGFGTAEARDHRTAGRDVAAAIEHRERG